MSGGPRLRSGCVILRPHQTESVGFVAQNQFNLGIEFFRLNGVDNRLKIGTAAGEQNRDRNLSCHIILRTNRYALRALANFTDDKTALANAFQHSHHRVGVLFVHDENHAQAHIERRLHLRLGDRADFLNQAEDRRHRPTCPLNHRMPPLRQYPRQISANTAAGDMRCAFDGKRAEQFLGNFSINARRFEQLFAEFATELGNAPV